VAKLRDLTPPEADRNRIAAMLANFERGSARGQEIANASRAGDDPASGRRSRRPSDP
jgi:hypothetical protein